MKEVYSKNINNDNDALETTPSITTTTTRTTIAAIKSGLNQKTSTKTSTTKKRR